MDAWTDRALQRLEYLEAERGNIAAMGPSAAAMLAECDTEIAALYEVLEAAADDADDGEAEPLPEPPLDLVAVPMPEPIPAASATRDQIAPSLVVPPPEPAPIPAASPRPVPTFSPAGFQPIAAAQSSTPAVAAPSAPMILAAATAAPSFGPRQPGVPELFLGDQNTLTYVEHVGWTTFRDLEPLPATTTPALPTTSLHGGIVDFTVDDDWGGSSLGWKWMIPVAAALLLFVVIGAVIGLQPSEAVATEAVGATAERQAAPAAAASEQSDEHKARWAAIASTPIGVEAAEVPPDTQEPQAAVGAADVTVTPPSKPAVAPEPAPAPASANKASKKKRRQKPRSSRGKASDRRIHLGEGRDPLAGM